MTTIGTSVTITGDIITDEDLVIEGRVRGQVVARGALLTIAPQGRVEAEVRGVRVRVLGAVRGAINASERIELAASASVDGTLSANHVIMAEGAIFNGSIDMDRRTIAAKVAQYKSAQPA